MLHRVWGVSLFFVLKSRSGVGGCRERQVVDAYRNRGHGVGDTTVALNGIMKGPSI
jgi:hypothetical protein